jgi:hypothetical protein
MVMAPAKGPSTSEPDIAQLLVDLYGQIHRELREEVSGLTEQALGWMPGPGTNSISTIVVHLLGSETEVLRIVRGLPSTRDRSSEFTAPTESAEDLLRRVDAADRLLREVGPQITDEDLSTRRVRPGAVRNRDPKTGLFWLLNSYGHAREHVAHLQLTKQLVQRLDRTEVHRK